MIQGCDTAAIVTPYVMRLAGAGCKFVGRYQWSLTVEEVAAIHSAQMRVLHIFEGGRNATTPAYFTAAQGDADARKMLAKAAALGQPKDSGLYFAVDTNPAPDDGDSVTPDVSDVVKYFQRVCGLVSVGGYRVGAYGSGLVLETLGQANLIELAMLANASGWYGSKDFTMWNVHQYSVPRPAWPGASLMIDACEAYDLDEAGCW